MSPVHGVKDAPFSIPRAHPHSIDINVRCMEGVEYGTLAIHYLDRENRGFALEEEEGAGGALNS